MYLVDTNVFSERRKGRKADPGVVEFFRRAKNEIFLPVQVVGEIEGGIERLRQRGDHPQAKLLEKWFGALLAEFSEHILALDLECAKVWGVLIGVNEQHSIDKQIAAIALMHDLTIVTRNTAHFSGTGARILNPFLADSRATPVN
ncbi:MAG TPA: type II toxin-antitoxin system VapC family toxin [Terracidiphilus sp.]|nr:type II toxin-antitoxin system VapC family toxin [Terracidiphilus sp.]